MTPDELRALADALCVRHYDLATVDVIRAADYLRACADEKPVGYVTANGLRSLRQDDATVLLYAHDYLIRPDHVALYAHPAPAAPQAEPKREPLSDERIAEIQRAAYERAAQECIETAAELRRCADGCTDGRYDWKADGALDCADAIRALGMQHD